jgi:hypothetical protein
MVSHDLIVDYQIYEDKFVSNLDILMTFFFHLKYTWKYQPQECGAQDLMPTDFINSP